MKKILKKNKSKYLDELHEKNIKKNKRKYLDELKEINLKKIKELYYLKSKLFIIIINNFSK